jgi:hypothetical protein
MAATRALSDFGMGGNCPELFEGSSRVLASGLGKFGVDLVTGALGSTGSSCRPPLVPMISEDI